MENTTYSNELQHHGTKGMRWGIRRYQNPDGSLTPAGRKRYNQEVEKLKSETAKVAAQEKIAANRRKTQSKLDSLEAEKQKLAERKKALRDEKYGKKSNNESEQNPNETVEERRARALKSTDPAEIYKNKDLLTTNELNERLFRIDTEARLNSKIVTEHEKTGMERIDDITSAINKGVNVFRTVDNAYSTVANSAIGKTLAEKLGIEPPKKVFNPDADMSKMSLQEVLDFNKASLAYKNAKNIQKERKQEADAEAEAKKAEKEAKEDSKKAEKARKEAQKQVDDYNAKGHKDDKVTSTSYSPNGEYSFKKSDLKNGRDTVNKLLLEDKSTSINNAETTAVVVRGKSTFDDIMNSSVGRTKYSDISDVEYEEIE